LNFPERFEQEVGYRGGGIREGAAEVRQKQSNATKNRGKILAGTRPAKQALGAS
jgi:hypothetical protein